MRGGETVDKVHGGDEAGLGCAAADVHDIGVEGWLGVRRRRGGRSCG